MSKNKEIQVINKALNQIAKKSYNAGVIDAMSVAVNLYNCEPQIREWVLNNCLKK